MADEMDELSELDEDPAQWLNFGEDEEEALGLVRARSFFVSPLETKKRQTPEALFGAQFVRCRWKKTLVVVPSIERTALLIVGVLVRRSLRANDGNVKEDNAR